MGEICVSVKLFVKFGEFLAESNYADSAFQDTMKYQNPPAPNTGLVFLELLQLLCGFQAPTAGSLDKEHKDSCSTIFNPAEEMTCLRATSPVRCICSLPVRMLMLM